MKSKTDYKPLKVSMIVQQYVEVFSRRIAASNQPAIQNA